MVKIFKNNRTFIYFKQNYSLSEVLARFYSTNCWLLTNFLAVAYKILV